MKVRVIVEMQYTRRDPGIWVRPPLTAYAPVVRITKTRPGRPFRYFGAYRRVWVQALEQTWLSAYPVRWCDVPA